MINRESKETIQSLCPEIADAFLEDFLARMDDDYFSTFSAAEIATHIRMSAGLDAKHRVQVRITSSGGGEFEIIIAGFDYPSQFSIFSGLLSAFGLDIRAGDIYSFSKRSSKALSKRIVDVFRVALKPGEAFEEEKQREFEQELHTLTHLLGAGSVQDARERLNRFLVERIETMNEPLSGLLSAVELQFDNLHSPDWTVMDAHSEDAFAFLYAVSNALSMRGIYIHSVKIRSDGHRAKDRFFIADSQGRKIEDIQEQQRLRMAIEMIKQFTRFLPEAPDPAKAMRHFDQFLDRIVELGKDEFTDRAIAFFAASEGMIRLARVLGSSDFLWDDLLRIQFKELLPVLEDSAGIRAGKDALRKELVGRLRKVSGFDEQKAVLNQFKDRQVFLIDVKHLLEPNGSLLEFSHALTALAEVAIEEAARICYDGLVRKHGQPRQEDGTPCPFAICGLGKFGGREMGYASDLELLFVHDGPQSGAFFESFARQVVEFIEARDKGIFHIDLRLRPHGDAGSWSSSFDQFTSYYSVTGGAAPFERQALIKLRWFGGDEALGRRVEAHRDSFTYSNVPWDWANAAHLRRRQMRELVKPGQVNVKYSAGGIVDIEYAAQYLQLLNGYDHPEVRVHATLEALDRLRGLQIVRETDYRLLNAEYLFLRNLIDALRIVRGDANDLVLPEESSEEFKSLARRLGYRKPDRTEGAARLAGDIRETMKRAHAYFVARFEALQ